MRKRIVIALIAVVAIGLGAYVTFLLSGPKRGSVEYHKREFLRARHWGMADEGMYRYGPGEWMSARLDKKNNRLARHQNALINLGYLEERTVVVRNPFRDVLANMLKHLSTNSIEGVDEDFCNLQTKGTNVFRIVVVKGDASTWERLIREADVPESGK